MLGITNTWAAYQLDYVTAYVALGNDDKSGGIPNGAKPGDTLPDGRTVGSWRSLLGG